MKIHNIAVIGTGMISKSHFKAIRALPNARCAAVTDADESLARAAAEQESCEWYPNAESLLEAQPEIDVCLILTPTFTHADIVELCAKYKKAVICEKPFEISVENAKRILEAVEKSGITYMTAQVVRFWVGYTRIKQMLDDGEIGDVHMAYLSRKGRGGNPLERAVTHWMGDPQKGGGSTYDMMAHDTDFLQHMFGSASSVFSHAYAVQIGDRGEVYPSVFASIEYKNGVKAVAEASAVMRGDYPFSMFIRLMGSKATVEFTYEAGANINERDDSYILMRIFRDVQPVESYTPEDYDAYEKEIAYFLDCLDKGVKPSVATAADGLEVVRVLAGVRESAAKKTKVFL